jgi:two-component system response regulator HydG
MVARLAIEIGVGSPQKVDLDPVRPTTLGRSRESTVVLHDEHASRQHAQIYSDNGQWFIRDFGTLNGTFVNGDRIAQPVALQHGQSIGIADMRLRFLADQEKVPEANEDQAAAAPLRESRSAEQTSFWPDELAALYEFMTATVDEKEPAALIEQALETIARRTRASVCGFLSLDPEEPLSKRVFPQAAEVDAQLSRQLTRGVQETGRTVWLQALAQDVGVGASESLACYVDALCVPLNAEGAPLGAVHVYKSNGAFTTRDVRFCEVLAGYAARSLTVLRMFRSLAAENSRLRQSTPVSDELIGSSPAMQNLRQRITRAAASSATVLVHGETGVGKELVASALHQQSPRAKGPLVVANCGAIAKSLWESELFGHARGAFTGAATAHAGLFEQADDGTLFLDEIGDMPLDGQVKLLRAIESKTFRPVGATKDVRADVRVVAATHRELEQEVKAGKFREDLFYRLRVIYIPVPRLRDHAEDIPELVEFFLAKLTPPAGRRKKISAAVLRRLQEYPWPGNVRQLRGALENAVIMGDGDTIEAGDFYLPDMHAKAAVLTLEELESRGIGLALEQAGGNVTQAAKLLGIHRETLGKKIKQYELGKKATD